MILLMPQETTSEETFRQALKCDWKRCTTAPPACHGLKPTETPPDIGHDTETAIRAGVVRGIGYELQGCIRHWQKRHPDLRIFLTGGDRFTFSDALRKNILTDSHLVARGLNKLLLNYIR